MSLALKVARAGSQGGVGGNVQEGGFFDVLKGIGRTALGFVTGGPVGAAAGLATSFTGGGRQRPPQLAPPPSRFAPAPGARAAAQRLVPGGATGLQKVPCPSGWHANKQDYFLRDGTFVAAGSRCVKNRRRNPMNARALDRSIGRVDSAKRLQHKLNTIETAKYTKTGKRKETHTHG